MFADSLCKERVRGRQGWDAHPRSLLAPQHTAVPVAGCVRACIASPPCLPTAHHIGHPRESLFQGSHKCLVAVCVPACSSKLLHLQKVAGLSCDKAFCHCRNVWPCGSPGKLQLGYDSGVAEATCSRGPLGTVGPKPGRVARAAAGRC